MNAFDVSVYTIETICAFVLLAATAAILHWHGVIADEQRDEQAELNRARAKLEHDRWDVHGREQRCAVKEHELDETERAIEARLREHAVAAIEETRQRRLSNLSPAGHARRLDRAFGEMPLPGDSDPTTGAPGPRVEPTTQQIEVSQ